MAQNAGRLAGSTVARREIERMFDRLDHEGLAQLTKRLAEADRRVFFTGSGRSGMSAQMAAMRFMHLGKSAHFVGEATAPSIRAGDTMVIVSASGRTSMIVNFAEIAKKEGASIILITKEDSSPLRDIAEASLVIPVDGTQQFGGTLFEQSALIVLDSIVLDLMSGLTDPVDTMWHNHTNLQ
jgi:6-phospho-3-hexuloisomerase